MSTPLVQHPGGRRRPAGAACAGSVGREGHRACGVRCRGLCVGFAVGQCAHTNARTQTRARKHSAVRAHKRANTNARTQTQCSGHTQTRAHKRSHANTSSARTQTHARKHVRRARTNAVTAHPPSHPRPVMVEKCLGGRRAAQRQTAFAGSAWLCARRADEGPRAKHPGGP